MVVLAMILDAIWGEPAALWSRLRHPVVAMGRGIGWIDTRLNRGSARRLRGALGLALLIGVWGIGAAMLAQLGWLVSALGAAALIAQRSLADHVAAVASGLRQGLDPGRQAVSHIVGRDVAVLDQAGVARAAIESAAENFSDGVVAPIFWFAVAGLPGIVLYKLVNTADSMIGHRTPRHEAFGWAAARLDDLLNLVPARLSGALLCLVGGGWAAVQVMRRDARAHKSPNAGWPESAMAASLGLALNGPRVYDGALTDDPYVNPQGRIAATVADIDAAVALLWRAWAVILGLAVLAVVV